MPTVHQIPSWQLYGEDSPFPDLLHIEKIVDRAAGLDWRIAPHRHLHLHQVFLIQSGQMHMTSDGNAAEVTAPVLLNIPRDTVHGFAFTAGTEGYVLTLPAVDFPELFGPQAETRDGLGRAFLLPPPDGIAALFEALSALHVAPDPFRRLRLRATAVALCCMTAEIGREDGALSLAGDVRMARFEGLIRQHLSSGWLLPDYARALGVSERHLRRLCQLATGLSAHAFVEAMRLREACRLLAYTRMQVQAVGYALGFEDPAYFARVFRKGTGLSPAAYRGRLER